MNMTREMLNLIARMCNVDPTTYPNDSKLEQRVLYELKNAAASGAATVAAIPTAGTAGVRNSATGVSGDKNI